jgi:uncharacterized protein (DUF952 family)
MPARDARGCVLDLQDSHHPMPLVYHLATPADWEKDPEQPYRPGSLASEGFIHCSHAHQVAWAANKFYAAPPELLVLHIDAARLSVPLRDEPGGPGGELFPHIHGPLDRSAVVAVTPLVREAGAWVFRA